MQRSRVAVVAGFVSMALCGASAAAAGEVRRFPLEVEGHDASIDGLRFANVPERVRDVAGLDAVTLVSVLLPDGRAVDLDLARIRTERMRFEYFVDGVESPAVLDGLDLSVWRGEVRGLAGSEALLSFSQVGAHGWIRAGGELFHLMPQPDATGSWWNADTLIVAESALGALGLGNDAACGADRPRVPPNPLAAPPPSGAGGPLAAMGPGCTLREGRVSIESDFQYYQRFNDVGAQATYTTTLWAFISDRFESQANTLLVFPYVGFYTTPNDPWTIPDLPGSSSQMLSEFRNAWAGNVPNGGRVGHFMSGASLGGGVAWLDSLCSDTTNFAVSGNLDASVVFPVVVAPTNWDFMVCAHELGHNFGAPHTHEYCPPLDQCAPPGWFGPCQSQQACSSQGTLMSYCHLCGGGMSNVLTTFHPVSAQVMAHRAQLCLPRYAQIVGTAPTLVAEGATTPVSATVIGTPTGPVQLLWRANPGQAFAAIDMTDAGGGAYTATLPAFGCADDPELYYSFAEPVCGSVTYPELAPASLIECDVGIAQAAFADTFQTNLGWAQSNLGATAGDWERGVPIDDPNWAYGPSSDGDGSGVCWLTANQLGNSDVDGGAVRLRSPQLDLTGGEVQIEYLYYLWLSFSDGDDRLLVEISADGTNGPWIEIARHATTQGSAWVRHTILGSDIAAAGAPLGPDMRVRFTANDSAQPSLVEAGVDGFRVLRIACGGIGAPYCASTPNSSGAPALASASGSASVAANDLVLSAAPLPLSSNGLFFYGVTASQIPFGNGVRCVATPTLRLPLATVSNGVLTCAVDNTGAPALTAGSTWNFQAWFRDAAAGGSKDNLSDGYRITFTP